MTFENPIDRFNNLIQTMKPVEKYTHQTKGFYVDVVGTFENGICLTILVYKGKKEAVCFDVQNVLFASKITDYVRIKGKYNEIMIHYDYFSKLF